MMQTATAKGVTCEEIMSMLTSMGVAKSQVVRVMSAQGLMAEDEAQRILDAERAAAERRAAASKTSARKQFARKAIIIAFWLVVWELLDHVVDNRLVLAGPIRTAQALADQVDVIFTATPQGLCASLVNEEILSKAKVIDLSADFRIKDVKKYEEDVKKHDEDVKKQEESIRTQQQIIEKQKEDIRKQQKDIRKYEEETRKKELDQEKKQKLEIAKNLLKENIDIDIILKVTSLNKEDIKGLNF